MISTYQAKLVQIYGEYLGCGKSLTAVEYGYREHLATGYPVYSNIHLAFSVPNVKPEPLEIILMRRYRNAILVLDELYLALEARGSESGSNKGLTDEIFMNRKRGNTIYATSPDIKMVDKRFRNIADFTIKTERVGLLNDRLAVINAYIAAVNSKNADGIELLKQQLYVEDTCDLYNTNEEVQSDRLAYIYGLVDIVTNRKDSKGKLVLDKIKTSKLPLQKAYLKNVFHVFGVSDQLMVLDELGLLA